MGSIFRSKIRCQLCPFEETNTVTRVTYRSYGSHRQHKQTNPFQIKIVSLDICFGGYKTNGYERCDIRSMGLRHNVQFNSFGDEDYVCFVKPNWSNRQNNGSGTYRIGTRFRISFNHMNYYKYSTICAILSKKV